MSFGGRCMSYEELFAEINGPKMTQKEYEASQMFHPQSEKRRSTQSNLNVLAKKRAKMTRGDELSEFFDRNPPLTAESLNFLVDDETAKQAAREILDQIQDTPGQIALNFSRLLTAKLCPIPSEFVDSETDGEILGAVREGQLNELLRQNRDVFRKIKSGKVHGGRVETHIPAREMGLNEALDRLKRGEKWMDEYVGFASAVANILRRFDVETAERVAQSIAATLENEAVMAMN